ncbi:Acyltransferase family protein [Paraliobacillus sp. PM-2]|uniref:acyltransferase family protein n=1 Tax=Paraliobacillus sp. PM-2 TaxID=1462524 RepID=UPI00061C271F|nr:acyltransferase family protein [Paraliobacillus sp. PM-2]CQR46117.1 Acyltransferase family protein [Paraliobacillus sp. PM-2]
MKREAFFDNAKFILIFLVVFGHMIQPFTDNQVIEVLYYFIYIFHMPAFILLSGFFAKGVGDLGYIWSLCRKLIMPYLIFQLLYSGYYYMIGDTGWQTAWYKPHWALWFLLSLFCWHILLIVFKKIPSIFSIIIAVEIGIIVGYIDVIGHALSLSRTFVFFPFFLIGYWLSKEQLIKLSHPLVKGTTLLVFSVVMIALTVTPSFSSSWLLGSFSYSEMGQPIWGGVIRFGVYLLAIIITCGVFAWIPWKTYSWTKFGKQTLYVYLLHGLFIQFFREAGWFKVGRMLDVVGLAMLSMFIVLLLSSRVVFVSFQPFIEGKITQLRRWIDKRKERKNRELLQ